MSDFTKYYIKSGLKILRVFFLFKSTGQYLKNEHSLGSLASLLSKIFRLKISDFMYEVILPKKY